MENILFSIKQQIRLYVKVAQILMYITKHNMNVLRNLVIHIKVLPIIPKTSH